MRFFFLLLVLLLSGAVHAQTNLLHNGDFAQGTNGWSVGTNDRAKVTVVEAQAGPFQKALRFEVNTQAGDKPWSVQLQQVLGVPVKVWDTITLKVWLRSPDSSKILLFAQEQREPFAKFLQQEINLTPQWQEYEVSGSVIQTLVEGEAGVGFHLAYGSGTIEVAGVRLLAMPPQPQLDLRLGHGNVVNSLALSPDEKTIASGSWDQTIKLWDIETGELRRSINPQLGGLSSVAFSPDGKLLAAIGWSGYNARLLDARTGRVLRTLHVNSSPSFRSLVFSPDGQSLYIAGDDATIRIWDVSTGQVRRTLTGHNAAVNALAVSRDGKLLVSGSTDKTVKLWDAQTGELRQTLGGQGSAVLCVAISSDGLTVASGSEDKSVRLWNAQTGEVRKTLTGNTDEVHAIAFSPDGKTLASGSNWSDGYVRLWDIDNGKILHTVGSGLINTLLFSSDGKTLLGAGGNKKVMQWDVQSGKEKRAMGRDTAISSVVWSPDGKSLIGGGSENEILQWDAQTGELKKTIAQLSSVGAVTLTPDGKLLASGNSDNTIRLWDTQNWTLLRTLAGHDSFVTSLAISSDGHMLASRSNEGIVKLWNLADGTLLRSLQGGSGYISPVAFSPDGTSVASGSDAGLVHWWDTATGTVLHTLTHQTGRGTLRGLVFSPDGTLLASGGSDGTIKLWDRETATLLKTLKAPTAEELQSLAFSPDGKILVHTAPTKVYLWDMQSKTLIKTLEGHGGGVYSAAFLPGGRTLATSGEDQIKLWELNSGRLLASLIRLPSQASTQAPTSDAQAMAADGPDVASSDYLVVTPEGYYSGSAQADRFVYFKMGEDSYPAECFQARYYRPDLVKLALSGQQVPPVGDFKGAFPPIAQFAAQHDGETVTGDTTTVSLETSDDSGVQSVAFFINGARVDAKITATEARPLTADSRALVTDTKALIAESRPLTADSRLLPASHKITRTFSVTLPLPPDDANVQVQAIAFDDDGLQSPRAEMTLMHAKTGAATGKLLGLCVGVSRYKDERLNLKYADADANALANDFNRQKQLYSATQVTTLTNEQATSAAVIAALDTLIARTTRADTLVISLSGHGWRDDDRNFYFATHEVNRNDIAHSALPWSAVVERLTKLSEKSKRVIVLLDACHSGSAATNEEMVKAILGANSGVLVFASSRGSEVSLENGEWAHGAFTKALLEATQGMAAPPDEKTVTTLNFLAYVSQRVKTLTENQQHPQVPFLRDFDTDAPIVANP